MADSPAQANVFCVTFNNASTIEALMRSIARQAPSVACLVITDNGSSDNTLDIVRAVTDELPFPVAVIASRNVGFSRGVRLAGESECVKGWLPTLCVNPDLVLEPAVLSNMLALMANDTKTGVVTAPLVGKDGLPDSASIRTLPTLGMASVYAILGRLTPRKWRYNQHSPVFVDTTNPASSGRARGRVIEATTGALMLVNPHFRDARMGIFDTSYWMYGEDLQLCLDARAEQWKVVMMDFPPSLHIKGVSSGWPRSPTSNRAFHDAMRIYFDKNLAAGFFTNWIVRLSITARLQATQAVSCAVRVIRRSRGMDSKQ
jgi:N-acetylglucosaminyl-diphospho-decaprenol L-rhamnosyltransferase